MEKNYSTVLVVWSERLLGGHLLLLLLWAWILVGFELCIAWKGGGRDGGISAFSWRRAVFCESFWVLFWILVSIVDVSQLPILPKKK
jgi:hypothetical protein